MTDKIIYQEGYKKPFPQINKQFLPECKHLKEGLECVDAHIMKGGIIKRDGEELQFQEIRVFYKEK